MKKEEEKEKKEIQKSIISFNAGKRELLILFLAFVLFAAIAAGSIAIERIRNDESTITDLPQDSDNSGIGKLIISEVMSNNKGVYMSENNEICDYVELYNGSDKDIYLQGYCLSDRDDVIKWMFPDVKIAAKEYLVVNLVGYKTDGLNANFKLSSKGGEKLMLFNTKGKIIDGLDTVALGQNEVLIRDNTGWIVSDKPTPGYENSISGYEAYVQGLNLDISSELVVNELLCKNKGSFKNEFGRYDGFIELKNISSSVINLSDYCISNDINIPFKLILPDVQLNAGDVFCLYTGDASSDVEKYTGFTFYNKQGSVVISKNGKIIEELKYESVPNGCAYVRDADGSYYLSSDFTMDFENISENVALFEEKYITLNKSLVINEVMRSNSKYLAQNGGQYYDWIELWNNSDEAVELSDYCLSDSEDNLLLQQLPAHTLLPGEYYVVMCSGDNNLTNDSYFHANFKIGDATPIYLSKNGKIVDSTFIYSLLPNYSFARGTEYGFLYTSIATPLAENTGGYYSNTPVPVFETVPGTYEDVEHLSVKINGKGTIYYTTDGSDPTTGSAVYNESIELDKTCSIKVIACIEGAMPSKIAVGTFVINDPHPYPVVSLVLDPDEYALFAKRPFDDSNSFSCSFELFEEDGSCQSFCNISLMGHSSRIFDKKSFAIRFSGEYGATSLNYRVFDDIDCASYESLIVRGGSNSEDSLPWKDEFTTVLARDYLETRTYKTCVVYINGVYRGIYNLREKINASMIADHYNVDKERVTLQRWDGTWEHGGTEWSDMVEWGTTHDLSLKENYDYFCERVDVVGLVDLWVYQAFFNNCDIYNLRVFSHPDIDNGQCKFIFFDLDMAYWGKYTNYFTDVVFNKSGTAANQNGVRYDISINNALLKNDEFKKLFIERMEFHLNNHLSNEYALKVFDSFTEIYAPEVARSMEASDYSMGRYNTKKKYIRDCIVSRPDELRKLIKSVIKD